MAIDQQLKEQRLMRMTRAWYECDGHGVRRLASVGMAWLEQHYHAVNALNVFPVPDGDTGINMLLTMRNAWSEIKESTSNHAGDIAGLMAKGAVMGSRGNSGVILSQLWLGFAQGIEGLPAFDADGLVKAMKQASESADNVRGMKPVEGTILTVARDGAKAAEKAARKSRDLRVVLEQTVAEMHRSVERTPDLLVKNGVYVLRDAGVVDAGGMGLVYILEGMLRYLNGEVVKSEGLEIVVDEHTTDQMPGTIDLSGLDFPYDVQFLLTGEALDLDAITETIENMGDSALVVGNQETIKVHVHVVNPGDPLQYASNLGTLSDVVVENMAEQYEAYRQNQHGAQPAQAEIQPAKVEAGDVAAIVVAPGTGLEQVFYSLGAAHVVSGGQTMNPSTEELFEAIESLPTNNIILLPNNKNILMAAEQAGEHAQDKQVRVVPSTTIPQGISALLSLDSQGDLDAIAEAMRGALTDVETGEITTATRTAKINGVRVKKGQYIGLHNDDLRVAGKDMQDVMRRLLDEMGAANLELITLYFGEDTSGAEAQAIAAAMREQFTGQEFEVIEGGQPHYHYILSAE